MRSNLEDVAGNQSAAIGGDRDRRPDDRVNVVLVTVDSLRPDALSPYEPAVHTPTIDALAGSGTVFENAFAHGNWTPMSFPSILASRPTFADTGEIGVRGVRTLARALQEAGVTTAGFNAANGFLTAPWGFDDGFDEFDSFIDAADGSSYTEFVTAHPTVGAWLQLASSPVRRLRARLRGEGEDQPFTDTSRLLDVERRATSFLRDLDDEPFFLWLHFMDAHTPYVPAPRYLQEVTETRIRFDRMLAAHVRAGLGWTVGEETLADLRTLYRGAVRQVDDGLRRLRTVLEECGLAEQTAVILCGDHGEEFLEHGHLAHYPKLYDELIHVPLIVSPPGGDASRVHHHVGLDAVPPTVCSFLGVDPPASWVGESLYPVVARGATPPEDPVVSVTVRGEDVTQQPIPRGLADGDLLVSARTAEWAYIENTATGDVELYHRPSDPDQQDSLAADPTASAARDHLQAAVREHVALLRRVDADGTAEPLDPAIEDRLDALGYR